jgi:[protein-PII] uridylyltransferase
MTFFKYRTRSLLELQQKEMISETERKQLEQAYDFLLWVRNELHYHANRALDVISKSIQPTLASNLGYSERSPSKRLEMFMKDFYTHSRNIDLITRTVEQRMALLPSARLIPAFRQMIKRQRQKMREQLLDGFKIVDHEIQPVSARIFRDHPNRLMRVFLYAQQRGLRLNPDLAQMIRNHLSMVDNAFLKNEHVRETFLEILDQRGNVAWVLRMMHEVGFLGKFLPEFGKLTCLVQHEFYHQYTADEHTLVCLEKLDQVWHATQPPFNTYTEIFQNLEQPYLLYLALLLHDSGKAYRTGKHEEVGSKLALKVARRLGLDGAATHALSLIIEHHLTMAQVSQRRDLDDQTVIKQFAAQIQSQENLAMLTLHTFADSMGTSDQLWNSFKDTLLWTLFHKTRHVLSGGTDFIRAEARQRELMAEHIKKDMPRDFDEEEVDAHFSNLPPRYFQIHTEEEVLADISLIHEFMKLQLSEREEALAPVVSWKDEPDRGYTMVTVCTWDRAGLFTNITGCLTAAGLNILGAEIITRTDGIILDTFYVTDAKSGHLARKEERERFEQLLHRVLTGDEIDFTGLIRKQKVIAPLYVPIGGERIPVGVDFDNNTSKSHTIIDIEAEDRVGLLYAVTQKLAELNLDVSVAKIGTEKGAAMDTLYVRELDGKKITDPDRLREICRELRAAIAQHLETS